MKENLYIYYDEEGGFLELSVGEYTKGYFRDISKGVTERVDEETGKITGLAILGFKKKTRDLKEVKVSLPVKIELGH